MLNWLKKNKSKGYRSRIKRSFPKYLERDVEAVLNILPLNIYQIKSIYREIYKVENLIHESFKYIRLNNEGLSIPCRVYFNEPDSSRENILTEDQRTILNCIYLMHHDGFVRQKHLEQLDKKNQYWVTPFTFQLLGEYVFEILEVLDRQLDDNKLENYKRFVIENPEYYQQTEHRMISYWNEYYRSKFPWLNRYNGRIIFDLIKTKVIGERMDEIAEIGIDEEKRLFIKPRNENFSLVYRTATEVHWDNTGLFLYSPKPREWSYFDWYKNIIDVVDKECNCKLIRTKRTVWTNIPYNLKRQIISNTKTTV